jgi:ubiquinone/menaquinone biosynthesis C-methylase UbiE
MIRFLGIDYSEQMIVEAIKHLVGYSNLNATFLLGDVLELGKVCNDKVYDIVLTDRCLINLDSFESQCHAIVQIAKHTKLGGYYIAIENFVEGHENMNKARQAVGLPEIPVRWHNLYFKEKEFIQSVGQFFEIIAFKDFSSSYYFATRVVYSAMCHMRGEEPDYNHEIHQLSVKLPWVGQFSPIRMVVLHRKSK